MGMGASIVLFAIGAILAFAVHVGNTGPVDTVTIGWILMAVGLLGALLSAAFWSSWGGFNRRDGGTTTVVR
jgi:hypothetical protein